MEKFIQWKLDRILNKRFKWGATSEDKDPIILMDADLSGLKFNNADLRQAFLSNVNLACADLRNCDFRSANFNHVDFTNAQLSGAYFENTSMIDVKGLPTQEEMLDKLFKKTKEGYIVYKTFGAYYDVPDYWDIDEGSIIKEDVDLDRRRACSCGINVATNEWILVDPICGCKPIWKCLLSFDDLDSVCVPYGTEGKIRCGRLKLLNRDN